MTTDIPAAPKPGLFNPQANRRVIIRILVGLATFVIVFWIVLRFTAGPRVTGIITASVLRQPIEIQNAVENVHAHSNWWLTFTTPYNGLLHVEAKTLKGNPLDVHLVPQDQLPFVTAPRGRYKYIMGFEADKTRIYQRSGQVAAGTYALVLIDSSLGLLSAPSTDVRVHISLEQ